jgi:hypothetical protein
MQSPMSSNLTKTSPYPNPNNRPNQFSNKSKRRFWTLIVLIFWIVVLLVVLINRQSIVDWSKLIGYHPTMDIAKLASEDTMTPYAYRLFKINHPVVQQSSSFNVNCPNDGGEKTIVLGCYHSTEAGIYLLNVTDSRLSGVEQVTAAHEMLHAAYGQLTSSQRTQVDGMLLNYYNYDLHNQRIIATLAEYRKTEPGQVVNEMHSVFGTEIANLPAPLESYYDRYFTNRQKITSYAAQYESEFTTRENEVNQDDASLSSLKSEIDSQEASLKTRLSAIQNEQNTLTQYKSSGDDSDYNAGVAVYNQQIGIYNQGVDQLQILINNFNNLVKQRNLVALTENQLYRELSGGNQKSISH